MTEEKEYYQILERLHKSGFTCSCNPSNPVPGCVVCDSMELADIKKNPAWNVWFNPITKDDICL